MDIGMIGLGKMGANMAERLIQDGHRVVGFDLSTEAVTALVERGGEGADSLEAVAAALPTPQAVWVMVPAGRPVDATIEALLPYLGAGSMIVDGGNSFYKDTVRRAELCAESGVEFVDVGTSGGVWGLAEGYSMMVGGSVGAIERLRPVFESLAPTAELGWGHVGPAGSGHFVKMIHNGIEYGLMQAYAEGFAILEAKKEFDLDLHQIAEIWRHGSVVRSWLLELTATALEQNPTMDGIAPFVPDSGEGRWAVLEAVDLGVAAPIIAGSLFRRFRSRDEEGFTDRMLSAMRNAFGGHAIKPENPS
ncbi:MAG: decarboxylating 6-phosphogluconate dehydrogenase [Gammaproteobacteria bacterium]|nr:decarboxylating 6-phosphogluconate dehydrogenase [Gammaproteobacteria bacterium]